MRRFRNRLYAIVLTLATLTASAKTIRQYVRAQWLDPLPSANVLSLAQTRDGYLWIGTSEGLARFNGNDFVVFDTGNTSLQSDTISSLLAASDGTLWIGTAGGGLYRMDRGVITRVSSVAGTIRALAEDTKHTVWVASDRGVARLALRDAHSLELPRGAPQAIVRAICAIGDDVWFATDGEGLVFFGGSFEDYTTAEGLSSTLSGGGTPPGQPPRRRRSVREHQNPVELTLTIALTD
jgi:ligand-binding sensor domain-containing protein